MTVPNPYPAFMKAPPSTIIQHFGNLSVDIDPKKIEVSIKTPTITVDIKKPPVNVSIKE